MTVRAIPQGLFTWNFEIRKADNVVGMTTYRIFGESGELSLGERQFVVERQGPLSGQWRLAQRNGPELAVAQKANAFTRRIEMKWLEAGSVLTMEGVNPWSRTMKITANGNLLGRIVPDHLFTRKSTLEFGEDVPMEIQLFCLWLAVMLWRRAANNSSG
tara:strand:- start:34973 stop:35449 length:477 start_codon:yes stop_codon:yes gene_type:complete